MNFDLCRKKKMNNSTIEGWALFIVELTVLPGVHHVIVLIDNISFNALCVNNIIIL